MFPYKCMEDFLIFKRDKTNYTMKNKDLKLSELKVKSFVSTVETKDKEAVKGGGWYSVVICDTDYAICQGSYIC